MNGGIRMAYQIILVCILSLLGIHVHSLPSSDFHQNGIFNFQRNLDLIHQGSHVHHHRNPREMKYLTLRDPLDCLSQVVCGLNTYPPQKPSVRTSTANDFAYLLKMAVAKLRRHKEVTTTTTTVAPATKRSTTRAPLNDDDDEEEDEYDDDYTRENDVEDDDTGGDDFVDYSSRYRNGRLKRPSVFGNREGRAKKRSKKSKSNKKNKKKRGPNPQLVKVIPKEPTPLDRLRMEKDLRAKLLSEAQCLNGLIDHTCPFNYQQMLNLISSSLERERTVSYSSQKVLPMVGYLIKSRNYTGTLAASFQAIEKINNYTLEADRDGKPIDFSHILDEILNRVTGDAGLRIVDTSNDSASASVWEDDEFDHILQNPYERKRPSSDNYKVDPKKKINVTKKKPPTKIASEQADESTTSEEDTSEEGLVFDRPRPNRRPPPQSQYSNGPPDGESSSEEDDEKDLQLAAKKALEKLEAEKKEKRKKLSSLAIRDSKKKLSPGPVFSFGHLQKSAEDE